MRTPEADRFRHEVEVPDPPLSPKGRQRYWDDTVFEAVAELRKRLRSQDSDEALEALQMIVDLEKTRIRHASKVSGTHVPRLPDLDDDWGNPLPQGDRRDASPPIPDPVPPPAPIPASIHRRTYVAPLAQTEPLVNPPRIPGVTACFSDRDDDWTREPGAFDNLDADFDPVAAGVLPSPRLRC